MDSLQRFCRYAAVPMLFLAACSSMPPPKSELAAAEQAVNTALKGRAPELAPAEFKTAQDKLNKAKSEMSREDYVDARRLSEQARVDAELATATAEAKYASEMMRETNKSVRGLQDETEKH